MHFEQERFFHQQFLTEVQKTKIRESIAKFSEDLAKQNFENAKMSWNKLNEEYKVISEQAKQIKFKTDHQREEFYAGINRLKEDFLYYLAAAQLASARSNQMGITYLYILGWANLLRQKVKDKDKLNKLDKWRNDLIKKARTPARLGKSGRLLLLCFTILV